LKNIGKGTKSVVWVGLALALKLLCELFSAETSREKGCKGEKTNNNRPAGPTPETAVRKQESHTREINVETGCEYVCNKFHHPFHLEKGGFML